MRLKIFVRLTLLIAVAALRAQTGGDFLVKPYVQLGDAPELGNRERLILLWQVPDVDATWEVKLTAAGARAAAPGFRRLAPAGMPSRRIYRSTLTGLAPGEEFEYQIFKQGVSVFTARTRARKGAGQPVRFAVLGDTGAGSAFEAAIANRIWLAKPDFTFIVGDIAYDNGLLSDYDLRFFPMYNADQSSILRGAPLLRSILFLGAVGNHDVYSTELNLFSDGLAYFYIWDQPLNGPAVRMPEAKGSGLNIRVLKEASGPAYPRMANYSFNYGNAHWTVLDSNPYNDWSSAALRDWVAADLAGAKNTTWRFVAFHHPAFSSAEAHFDEQWMRVLSDVFEKGGVDVVFAGHVHNYQRSRPIHFSVQRGPDRLGRVAGRLKLDRKFDGSTTTHADGVIHIVTGAGGADLYDAARNNRPSTWQEFTVRLISDQHSYTMAEINGRELRVKQLSTEDAVLDQFTVTK